ncbi:hypothetical protein CPB85DRAFT_1391316 [Mucidula mucida]|nr:hypothetical protein CPB85DRAFT_1391316 [Mucidula mucida]
MILKIVIFASLFPSSMSLLWPRKPAAAVRDSAIQVGAPPEDNMSYDELASLLQNSDMLQETARRSDCFRHAAASIRVRCSDLDMDQDERVSAAISMTLCELGTAQHLSPPLECSQYAVNADSSNRRDQGNCVEALSRSAQFWSSYSGYLRDVPQLCFSFRRWHDIDTARDIYRNITREKITFLRFLTTREKDTEQHFVALKAHLNTMDDVTSKLHILTDTFESLSRNIATDLDKERQIITSEVLALVRDTRLQNDDILAHILSQIDAVFSGASGQYARSLDDAVVMFSRSVSAEIDTVFSSAGREMELNLEMVKEAGRRWNALGQSFAQMGLVDHFICFICTSTDARNLAVNNTTNGNQW